MAGNIIGQEPIMFADVMTFLLHLHGAIILLNYLQTTRVDNSQSDSIVAPARLIQKLRSKGPR
jgi:hypothetical protein